MLSTIEKDLRKVNGVMSIVPKEYPNWYGIDGIAFIWKGSWNDPLIEYKGRRCSCHIVEDTMWDRFTHDDDGNYIKRDENEFDAYMKENADEVRELCELALFGY